MGKHDILGAWALYKREKFLKVVLVQEIRQFTVSESKHSRIGSQSFLG